MGGGGGKPLAASSSAASIWAIRLPLSSHAPRPQTMPSFTTPANGGSVQSPCVPGATGTTSWCAINRIGLSDGSEPFHV